MNKTATQKKTNVNSKKKIQTIKNNQNPAEPRQDVIDNILNYSKELKTAQTEKK